MLARFPLLSLYSASVLTSCSLANVLTKRESCVAGNYTAPNTLQFTVICDASLTGGTNLSESTTTDVFACANACSTSRPLCYGAIFTQSSGSCVLQGLDATSISGSQLASSSLAGADTVLVTPTTQQSVEYDTTCPYSNLTSATTYNGMNFTAYCELDFTGNDYCPSGNVSCPSHATSLMQCLDFCAESHPLCWAVSYDPTMITGFGNCYLKGAIPAPDRWQVTGEQGFSVYNGAILHSAMVNEKNGSDIAVTCDDKSEVNATSGQTYVTLCDSNQVGDDLWSYHEDSWQGCVDACAGWMDGRVCVAVAWEPQLLSGWENCYLKNATGVNVKATNWTLGLMKSSLDGGSGPSKGTKGGTSKAWVAGPAVGGFIVLAVLALLLFWLKRRRSQAEQDNQHNDTHSYEKSELPATFGSQRKKMAQKAITEMGVETPRWELDGSSKPVEVPG